MFDLDYTPQINLLPRHPNARTIPLRTAPERWATLHYSGVPGDRYVDRSRQAELQRILAEARYQLNTNYGAAGKAPAYPDGYLYDFVILSDGTAVRTRADRRQLWHCGNATGNALSWSIHVMLGVGQDMTGLQRSRLWRLLDTLGVPLVGHCEWPRGDGPPVISSTYKVLPGQSECPGPVLHKRIVEYRSRPPATSTRVIGTRPSITQARFLDLLTRRQAPFGEHLITIGTRIYELCAWLDIDPAFWLAVWSHEQGTPLGSSEIGKLTRNPLNIKAYGRWPKVSAKGAEWNIYESWQLGCMASILHLKEFYGANGLLDVETIIPRFAPAEDNNRPDAYIAAVLKDMAAMRQSTNG